MAEMRIVGIGGSMAERSASLTALRLALDGARSAGATVEMWSVRELALPLFAPSRVATPPPEALRLCEAVQRSDGLVLSSPMYHGTISGSFKNTIDWLELLARRTPPYLTDKFVGLISTAGGTQGLQAVNTMEFIVRSLRGWAVPLVLPIPKAWSLFNDDSTPDPQCVEMLSRLGQEVVRAARRFKEYPSATREADVAESRIEEGQ
jgi:FMN reductase